MARNICTGPEIVRNARSHPLCHQRIPHNITRCPEILFLIMKNIFLAVRSSHPKIMVRYGISVSIDSSSRHPRASSMGLTMRFLLQATSSRLSSSVARRQHQHQNRVGRETKIQGINTNKYREKLQNTE